MILLLLAAMAAAPAPVTCPAGAQRQGGQPPEQYEEWCEVRSPEGRAVREGSARKYYDDGGLWVESGYEHGKLEGHYVERFRGGATASEGSYRGGLRTGTWRFFYEGGTIQEEASYSNGTPDGPFASYWPNGQKRTVGRRCGGAQCGRWLSYDEAGRLIGSVEYTEQVVP